ncbi:hypothetical protein ACFO4O_10730 [Glaciecola siphonariae]|uniref:Pectate lyase superfamily protein domain-containing protein n=1 Tax=Glaciecola siphonariae TaxID=521012 RepID=A0ABV9LXQ7_9ALTE
MSGVFPSIEPISNAKTFAQQIRKKRPQRSQQWLCAIISMACALSFLASGGVNAGALAQKVHPKILNKELAQKHYLPDFSYAGYDNGNSSIDTSDYRVIDVGEHGILPNDTIDDSKALITLLEQLKNDEHPSVLQFAPGRYIISSIIYFDRNYTVLRGAGSGPGGTEFYFPRPLIYAPDPPELAELREYLTKLNKVQREKRNNIELPFTQWAWSGGYFWTRIKDQRVKKYLDKFDEPVRELAKPISATQGQFTVQVDTANTLSIGQVIEIQWLNDKGKDGPLIHELYKSEDVYVGSHHWNFANLPLSRQQVKITAIAGNTITLASPLLHDINNELSVKIVQWDHLHHIGFEHFTMTFAYAEPVAHHVEQGFNGIYLTRLFNGWVDDVRITNADSGILTEEVANLSINNVVTDGKKYAHYSVQMGGVHNVLVDNLQVKNKVEHPLSFNTFASKSVYRGAHVELDPILDQHSGVNHQNLFDNISVVVNLTDGSREYPLFAGGGAKYWKPSHGAYNTFWNINVHFNNGHDSTESVKLNGMNDGVAARVIGVRANLPITVEYGPNPYIEASNERLSYDSLYQYQLQQRR